MMDFDGNRLKLARKSCGLTLEKLAVLCKSSKSYIWELENNGKLEPSGHKIFLLSQALNKPMEYFYGVEEDNTKQVLGTLITWLAQSSTGCLGMQEASKLLEILTPTQKRESEEM
jgi:transcriptional regulator with XRE-family HTH domain